MLLTFRKTHNLCLKRKKKKKKEKKALAYLIKGK